MKLFRCFFATLLIMSVLCVQAQKKPPRINHIAISVINLQKSQTFYQQILGLDTIPEPFHDGRHTWLSVSENAHLHLIQNPPPLVVPTKNTHLCFSVPDIQVLIKLLEKAKLNYEDWPGKRSAITTRVDGIHQIYLQDPDGYWIEVNDDYK